MLTNPVKMKMQLKLINNKTFSVSSLRKRINLLSDLNYFFIKCGIFVQSSQVYLRNNKLNITYKTQILISLYKYLLSSNSPTLCSKHVRRTMSTIINT